MTKMPVLLLLCVLALANVACGGDSDDAGDGTSTPVEPSPTNQPSTPETPRSATPAQSPAPTATSTPPADERPGASEAPIGTSTGEPELDALLSALLSHDDERLLPFFALTQVGCTNALGLGGPPKCRDFPGAPPEGTLVEAFPEGFCEGGWTVDTTRLVTQLNERRPQLFAVLQFNSPRPAFGAPGYPVLDHLILLEDPDAEETPRLGIQLGVKDGKIVWLSHICIGPPELAFDVIDPYTVVLRGPAYRPSGEDSAKVPQGTETGDAALDAIIAAVRNGDRAALASLFQLTAAPCEDHQMIGGPPICEYAPGSPPEGTIVEFLPHAFCEGTWAYDIEPIIDGMIEAEPQLYAVTRYEPPLISESGYPPREYTLVFEYSDDNFESLGMVVGVYDGRIVTQSYTCLSPPDQRIEHLHPDERVILYGPAYP